jgi:glutaminyl-tRNA synthetase
VSAAHAVPIEARIYDYLFSADRPMDVPPGGSFTDNLNPDSLEVIGGAWGEPSLAEADPATRYQFERLGYFVRDAPAIPGPGGGSADRGKLVFNKTIGLRDTWAKVNKNSQG